VPEAFVCMVYIIYIIMNDTTKVEVFVE